MGEDNTRSAVSPVSVDKLPSTTASGQPVSVSMPEYQASGTTSPSPVPKSPNQTGPGCTTCGQGGGDDRMLHRLKHDGVDRHHCSSCILLHNKGMYCSQCYQVYHDASELGDPGMWLTCSICQRLSHLQCARERGLIIDSSLFTCQYCKEASAVPNHSEDGIPPHKKVRVTAELEGSDDLSDQEALAAAQIVAALAAKRAKDARARARASAAAAVTAADRAKAALDAAHRACREELKWRTEAGRQLFPDVRRVTISSVVEQKVLGELVRPSNVMDASRSSIAPHRLPVEVVTRSTQIPSNSLVAPQRVSVITKQPQKPVRGCVSVDGSSLGALEGDTVAASVSPASTLEAACSLGTPTFSTKGSAVVNANSLRNGANISCSSKKGPMVSPHADGKPANQTDTRGITSLAPSVTEGVVVSVADVPPLTSSSDIEGQIIERSTDAERNADHIGVSEGKTEQIIGDLGLSSDQRSPGQPSGETVSAQTC